jgi:hypothetical protein
MLCPRCKGNKKLVYLVMSEAAVGKIHEIGKAIPKEPVPTREIDCPDCYGTGEA